MSISFLGSRFNLRLSYTITAIANVLGNCCGKEYRLLANNTDVLAQPLHVVVLDVATIN